MFELSYYTTADGAAPFEGWFGGLERQAKAKITLAIARLEQGNTSNVKAIGEGVSEYKLTFGPGYRIYFGMDGKHLVVLLTGGTKQRQSRDIATAKKLWAEYKRRKTEQ